MKCEGRPCGGQNKHVYHWKVTTLDKATGEHNVAKYCTIKEFNEATGYHFTADHIYKMKKYTKEQLEEALAKPKCRHFPSMYGHLCFEKIREPVRYQKIYD